MKLTKNKARIIVFLSKVSIDKRWTRFIARKLDIQYNNCSRLLNELVDNNMILKSQKTKENKVFYTLSYLGKKELDYAESVIYGG